MNDFKLINFNIAKKNSEACRKFAVGRRCSASNVITIVENCEEDCVKQVRPDTPQLGILKVK